MTNIDEITAIGTKFNLKGGNGQYSNYSIPNCLNVKKCLHETHNISKNKCDFLSNDLFEELISNMNPKQKKEKTKQTRKINKKKQSNKSRKKKSKK